MDAFRDVWSFNILDVDLSCWVLTVFGTNGGEKCLTKCQSLEGVQNQVSCFRNGTRIGLDKCLLIDCYALLLEAAGTRPARAACTVINCKIIGHVLMLVGAQVLVHVQVVAQCMPVGEQKANFEF